MISPPRMRLFLTLFFLTLLVAEGFTQIVINEVDADQSGTDAAEFVELFGPANASLDGLVLVFFNGNGDVSYEAFDLDGLQLDGDGFFVVCGDAANVANCDLDVSPNTNLVQNGADAVALYTADAADFPNGTAPTATDLIDALVYDTDDTDDSGLLDVLTPGQAQINEDGNNAASSESNSRFPDGGSPQVTTSYTQLAPTPGASNTGMSMGSEVVINEFVANHTGSDTHEFVEIFGQPSTDYSDLMIVQLEGDSEDNPGLVDTFYPVGSTDGDGYWTTGFLNNEIGNGTKTLLLVENFTGMAGADLDSDDDGILDTTPWDEILDSVGIDEEDLGDHTYGEVTLLAMFDGMSFTPGGASRIPNGIDTNAVGDWRRNAFNGVGLPGFFGELLAGEAANTPLAINSTEPPPPPPAARINEFVANHVGADTHEFIEIFGDADTDYSALRILIVAGDAGGNPGVIADVLIPGTTDIGGFWRTGFMSDMMDDGSLSLLLVTEFTGMASDDLDSDDDGVRDSQPWTLLLDSVAVDGGGLNDRVYSGTILGAGFDGMGMVPGGASRIPNGQDSDAQADWIRNDFDGEGLPGFSGTLAAGEALNTPGSYNAEQETGGNDALINELVADHTGDDDHEFLEIFGQADTNYSHLWIVQLEGDTEDNPGRVDTLHQAGVTDADGFWYSGFMQNLLGNGSKTLLLVEGFSGALDADLDAGDDGVLDSEPWTTLVDAIAIGDNDGGDVTYAGFVLTPGFDGGIFTVGGASRIPNGSDTDTSADWVRNDFFGAGLPGFTGNLDPGEALNTPNIENTDQLPPGTDARLSEFVANHVGADSHEFVEIFGEPMVPYDTTFVLVINGNAGLNPGRVDQVFQCGMTDSDGFWASGFQADLLDDGSITLLVVEDFSGMQGDDLDSDDNGVLDSEPWSLLQDAVAVDDGDGGDFVYSSVVLGAGVRGGSGHPGGASRYPYGTDTDTAADWRMNDFDGAGLPGFSGSLTSGEAYNTPARVNTVGAMDYFAGVDTSGPAALRASLHDRIDDHVKFPYTSSFTDTWDVLELADEDPLDNSSILSIYKNAPYIKQGGGNDFYNREHTWPKSFGFPDDEPDAYPYTDAHHLMLADSSYNSQRSNLAYGNCNAGCNEATTQLYNGQGGGAGVYPGNSNWFTGSGGTGSYEVWVDRRGDIARALFYLDLRYEGGVHGITGFAEPDLVLTDDTGLINTFGDNTTGTAHMGRLSVLLGWHLEDPVDALEQARNETVYAFQGNRNPFVDHPEWVDCLFNGDCPGGLPQCGLTLLAQWISGVSPCAPGTLDVRDYIGIVNGTCQCE